MVRGNRVSFYPTLWRLFLSRKKHATADHSNYLFQHSPSPNHRYVIKQVGVPGLSTSWRHGGIAVLINFYERRNFCPPKFSSKDLSLVFHRCAFDIDSRCAKMFSL